MKLTGRAKLAGVMGWPVGHSRSPLLHGYWLERYGIDGAYVPLAVKPEGLQQALAALPIFGFSGVNLTVPHKEAALAAMDETDALARRIGAVNTVTVLPDGRLQGRNTDAPGFLAHLHASAPQWRALGSNALVLGAGGAARAVAAALQDAGVGTIYVANRTRSRAEDLAAGLGAPVTSIAWNEANEALAAISLLVNATTLGMAGQGPLALALDALGPHAVVADIVYSPLRTRLLRDAAARNLATVDGLGMLIEQARPGFAAWFGVVPDVTAELRAELEADLENPP